MPDESCRTCGGDLIKWSTCSDCRKITQKICSTCNLTTVKDIHSHHISFELYKILETKNSIATIQSYSNLTNVKNHRKNQHHIGRINNILVIVSIVTGSIILGMCVTSYLSLSHNSITTEPEMIISVIQPDVIKSIKETHHTDTSQSMNKIEPTYYNCLGSANGISFTITCPTTYGSVYKAITNIPSDLSSRFETKIFNLRELSITEHVSSISILYEKNIYEAKFVNS